MAMEQISDVIERASDVVGSQVALAELCGVSKAAITQWKATGVIPAKHCKAVAEKAGVSCRDLRPDDWRMYWPELAEQSPTTTA